MENLIADHIAEASTDAIPRPMVADASPPSGDRRAEVAACRDAHARRATPSSRPSANASPPPRARRTPTGRRRRWRRTTTERSPPPRAESPAPGQRRPRPTRIARIVESELAASSEPPRVRRSWAGSKGPAGPASASGERDRQDQLAAKSARRNAAAPPTRARAERVPPARRGDRRTSASRKRGWMIQIGAPDDAAKANALLTRARAQNRSTLASAKPLTEKVAKGDATLYRARFAGLDSASAEAACRSLKRTGFSCFTPTTELIPRYAVFQELLSHVAPSEHPWPD